MDISIVIVNYQSKELILSCLESIRLADWSGLNYEIIVVDNSPSEGLAETLKPSGGIRYLENERNLGYGAANNLGIKAALGKYIVIMNPDTRADKSAFFKLYDFLEKNPAAGMVGPRQLSPDGSLQTTCFRWPAPLTPLYRRTPLGRGKSGRLDLDRFLYKDYNKESLMEVDWLLGSFLFCRAEALKRVGGFDENFFLYFEDTDLCKRFWRLGWKVYYYPAAQIYHNHQRLSATTPWYKFFINRAAWHHLASWYKYLIKWRGK